MIYLYYESDDSTFLLWEMYTDPPYEACISTKEFRKDENSSWLNRLPTRNEELDIYASPHPDINTNWSDEFPSISLLLTFDTLEDYFTWADQDHPELFV